MRAWPMTVGCEGALSNTLDLASLLGANEARAAILLRGLAGEAAEIEEKAYSDCRYLSCKPLGLSLRLKPASSGCVDVAFIYNEGVDGFSAYSSGPLPAGLEWSHTNRDVVKRLGEPSDRFGGGRQAVGISYELLGLDVTFKSKSWDDARNPMAFLAVFPCKDQAFDLCAKCCKQARFHCGRCRSRRYCSSACQKADWHRHQAECDGTAAIMAAAPALQAQLAVVTGKEQVAALDPEDLRCIPQSNVQGSPGVLLESLD